MPDLGAGGEVHRFDEAVARGDDQLVAGDGQAAPDGVLVALVVGGLEVALPDLLAAAGVECVDALVAVDDVDAVVLHHRGGDDALGGGGAGDLGFPGDLEFGRGFEIAGDFRGGDAGLQPVGGWRGGGERDRGGGERWIRRQRVLERVDRDAGGKFLLRDLRLAPAEQVA